MDVNPPSHNLCYVLFSECQGVFWLILLPKHFLLTSLSKVSFLAVKTNLAPSLAPCIAHAAPIPVEAPVIQTTSFFNLS